MKKVILITGTSRGIGKGIYEHLSSKGYIVYGSSRSGEEGNAFHIKLDVTDAQSCTNAVDYILKREGRIDILINNAGSHLTGASEETTLEEIDAQMQLNFYGMVNMTKAITKVFLMQQAGKIINMSSLGGILSLPFTSAYNASKFAVEGYSSSLRLELLPFGIYVSNIIAAFVNSGTSDVSIYAPKKAHPLFVNYRDAMHHRMLKDAQKGIPIAHITKTISRIIELKKPKFRYKIDKPSKQLSFFKNIFPQNFFERMVLRTFSIPLNCRD